MSSAGVVRRGHRREVGPVRHEVRRDAEPVRGTAREMSATDVRELVSSAMRPDLGRAARVVKSATEATGPREPMPTPGTNR